MGPLQMSDLAGNDIGYNIRKEFGWAAIAAEAGQRYFGLLPDKVRAPVSFFG